MRDFVREFLQPLNPGDATLGGARHVTFCPTQDWHRYVRETSPPGPTSEELIGYFYLPYRDPLLRRRPGRLHAGGAGVGDEEEVRQGVPQRPDHERHDPVQRPAVGRQRPAVLQPLLQGQHPDRVELPVRGRARGVVPVPGPPRDSTRRRSRWGRRSGRGCAGTRFRSTNKGASARGQGDVLHAWRTRRAAHAR